MNGFYSSSHFGHWINSLDKETDTSMIYSPHAFSSAFRESINMDYTSRSATLSLIEGVLQRARECCGSFGFEGQPG